MDNSERNQPEYLKAEFYPTLDNFAHVSQRFQRSLPKYKLAQGAYQAFIVINGLIFPAYLFFKDQYAWGFGLFLTTLVIWALFVPMLSRSANRTYLRDLLGDVSTEVATCEITAWGVGCLRAGNSYSVPWTNITEIERTEDAIYFYFAQNGMFVNDTGFSNPSAKADFYKFARMKWKEARLP